MNHRNYLCAVCADRGWLPIGDEKRQNRKEIEQIKRDENKRKQNKPESESLFATHSRAYNIKGRDFLVFCLSVMVGGEYMFFSPVFFRVFVYLSI